MMIIILSLLAIYFWPITLFLLILAIILGLALGVIYLAILFPIYALGFFVAVGIFGSLSESRNGDTI